MKKNKVFVNSVKIGVSSAFLAAISLYYFLYVGASEEKFKTMKEQYNNIVKEKENEEANYNKLKFKISDREKDKEAFVILNNAYVKYSERNKFIVEFTNTVKKVSGIKVNSIEYEKSDSDKKMLIKLNVNGSYSEIRNFLFLLEKKFLFIKTDECSLNRENDTLRGNVIYSVWFGDDAN